MKTLKNSFFLLAFLLLNTMIFAQEAPQKVLVTKLSTQQAEKVILDLEDRLEIQHWDKNNIAIYVEVNTNITHRKVVDLLVTNGRYEIDGFLNEKNNLMVVAPNLRKSIIVNSTPLEEELTFRLFLPKHQYFALAERFHQDILAVTNIKIE